ncbi:uncharacterized protein LOC134246650 [Saccostrea cucullata]|uniref:uncharacterized protein LOC134246650 n=1 Tax=Saccostrea cuccullata TaxID=36930 RepID=UPI002ED3C6F6
MEDTSIIKWCLFVLILSKNSDVLDTLERNHEECDYNYYFDEYNASCLECPFGSFGQNCMEQCISGFYGRLCGNACSCEAHKCNRVDGCPKVLTTSVLGSAGITLTSPQTSDTNQEMVKEFPLSWISTQGSEEYLSSQNKFTKSYSHSDTFTEKHFKGTTKHKRREGKTSVYSKKPMLPYQVTSTTKQPSNISNEEDHWMLTSVLLIILISGLVEPQFIYVHQTNARIKYSIDFIPEIQD